jgi:hypothetical protein
LTSLGKAIFTFSRGHQAKKRDKLTSFFITWGCLKCLVKLTQAVQVASKFGQVGCTFADAVLQLQGILKVKRAYCAFS